MFKVLLIIAAISLSACSTNRPFTICGCTGFPESWPIYELEHIDPDHRARQRSVAHG